MSTGSGSSGPKHGVVDIQGKIFMKDTDLSVEVSFFLNIYLSCVYHISSTIPRTLSLLDLIIMQCVSSYYYLHYIDEETEEERLVK